MRFIVHYTLQAKSIRSSVEEGCVRFDIPDYSITDALKFLDESTFKEGSETFIGLFLSDNELSDCQIRVNSVEILGDAYRVRFHKNA